MLDVRCWTFVLGACLAFCLQAAVRGQGARELVANGNRAYAQGDFTAALDAYDRASVAEPESAVIYFNRGATYFRQEDYEKAVESFEKAALKFKEPQQEARCKYNLGNCAFRECERQRDSDLKKALAACEKSIGLYQEALRLDPETPNAARNIEVARLTLKAILDEVNKKREEQEKQQQQQQEAVEKLKELIARQQAAAEQSQALNEEKREKGATDEVGAQAKDLAGAQRGLRQETEQLAQSMQSPPQAGQPGQAQQGPMPATPVDQAKQHMQQAVGRQEQAAAKLDQIQPLPAAASQHKAAEELTKALESLTEQQEQQQGQQQQQDDQQQQQQQDGQQQEQQQEKKEGQQKPEGEKSEEEQKDKEQQQAVQLPDTANDILNEEKENRDKRRVPQAGGYRPVDRDW